MHLLFIVQCKCFFGNLYFKQQEQINTKEYCLLWKQKNFIILVNLNWIQVNGKKVKKTGKLDTTSIIQLGRQLLFTIRRLKGIIRSRRRDKSLLLKWVLVPVQTCFVAQFSSSAASAAIIIVVPQIYLVFMLHRKYISIVTSVYIKPDAISR